MEKQPYRTGPSVCYEDLNIHDHCFVYPREVFGPLSYAIDFGTSNTVIARWNPITEQSEIITLSGTSYRTAQNPDLIPSLVYVEDAAASKVLVGQQVRDRGLDVQNDPRFFRSFKRGIGSPVQGFFTGVGWPHRQL